MGEYLVNLLSKDNIDIFVTSRAEKISQGNIHYLRGDAHDLTFLNDILNEFWDVIVDFMNYNTLEFENRIDLLLKSTSQYVFLSSSRVYAGLNKIITEESPRLLDICTDKDFLSTDEYSLSKARQENILKISNFNNWTIIRPYITYSKNRLQLGVFEKEDWLFRALNGKTIILSNEI
ncbi:MAG: epimerase, partial [Candidatus Cloacimonetes bacterium]|nr:epimerase [Candidatus Cloacimonadota bacterium]